MNSLACLVAAAMGLAVVAGAQESRGTIQGTVKDPQGGVVANAGVMVTNVDTKAAVNTRTSEVGRFSVPLLMPGNYTVTVVAAGFKKETRLGIELLTGDIFTIDLTLEVGAAIESVTVTAEAPL